MNFSMAAGQQQRMRNGNASWWRDVRRGGSGQRSVLFNYFITSQEEEKAALT